MFDRNTNENTGRARGRGGKGRGRHGRGRHAHGLNETRSEQGRYGKPGYEGNFDGNDTEGRGFGPHSEFTSMTATASGVCTLCNNRCPLSRPACGKGSAYARGRI